MSRPAPPPTGSADPPGLSADAPTDPPDIPPSRLSRALAAWVRAVSRHAVWVLMATALAVWLSLSYTAEHLGIDTDTAGMLAPDLPFQRDYDAYKVAFPHAVDTLVVVLDGLTPEDADAAAERLADRLRDASSVFSEVYVPGGGPFFSRNALLYLTPDELDRMTDRLAEVQPFLGRLTRDLSLGGFAAMLDEALGAVRDGWQLDLAALLNPLSEAVEAQVAGHPGRVSWQGLIHGEPLTADDRRRVIVVKPRLDFATLLPGGAAMDAVRDAARELSLDPAHGVRVRLTGDVALAHEELQAAERGARMAGILALVLVALVLGFGLRSPRLVVATVVTLAVGLVFTAGFATLAVGRLNMISVAFAVLYIGLGVDYGVHLCLRYRELRVAGVGHGDGMGRAAGDVGVSLVLCTVTTACGFFAFVPTAFLGVSELGLIAGGGMFISLAVTLTLLPAILALWPGMPCWAPLGGGMAARILGIPARHGTAVRRLAWVAAAGAVVLIPSAVFDYNPLHLRDPDSESVATYRALVADSARSPRSLSIRVPHGTDTAPSAAQIAARLAALPAVDSTLILEDFLPELQDAKLEMIADLSLMVGPLLPELAPEPRPAAPAPSASPGPGWQRLVSGLDRYLADPGPGAVAPVARLREALVRLHKNGGAAPDADTRAELEQRLLGTLPRSLATLNDALASVGVSPADLPDDLRQRWVGTDGSRRVVAYPRPGAGTLAEQREFVAQVQSVAATATGAPVVELGAGATVVRAFYVAFAIALTAIAGLLLVLLRSVRDTALVLVPLVLTALLTGAAAVLLGIPFNFANVITLPLLLGIGVDNGIHVVHRFRSGGTTAIAGAHDLLGTSTARAVWVSGLTTVASFGNLALAPHRGMASMGQLLTLGMVLSLFCTLVVLPALLRREGAT